MFLVVMREILAEEIASTPLTRYTRAKEDAKRILETPSKEILEDFGKSMIEAVAVCIPHEKERAASFSTFKEKAYLSFLSLRITKLPKMWKSFYDSLEMPSDDPLLAQICNRKLFERLLVESAVNTKGTVAESQIEHAEVLSGDEENALRYASGYVPFKLLKKYRKSLNVRNRQFVECLQSLSANEEEELPQWDHDYACTEEDFFSYSTRWISKVDRGGLFKISDTCYKLFH